MGIFQEKLKLAEAELNEAVLAFCAAEAAMNEAAWTFYEAQDVLSQKRAAVQQAMPAAV